MLLTHRSHSEVRIELPTKVICRHAIPALLTYLPAVISWQSAIQVGYCTGRRLLPVKKKAEKPDFWTVLSLVNVTRKALLSDVTGCGGCEPQ